MKFGAAMKQLFGFDINGEPKPQSRRSPSFTKKGPGRVHAGSAQKKVRSYRKHYEAKKERRS